MVDKFEILKCSVNVDGKIIFKKSVMLLKLSQFSMELSQLCHCFKKSLFLLKLNLD